MQTRSKSIKSGNKFQTNHDISVEFDLNGEFHTGKTNPLYIPEITDHMFQFLNLSDIKNCRSVCLKWNQLAAKFLKKLSVVNILKPERFEEFNRVFPNAHQSGIFTCLRFGYGFYDFDWPVLKFVNFFEKWHYNLSEITILWPVLGLGKENDTYDMSPLLPSTLMKLQLKSLRPKMILATDKICNIRILELENCILNLSPGTILNNVEIDLDEVTFLEDEDNIDDFLINPLLNFDVLKRACFSGKNITLDLRGSHSVEMVSFQNGVTLLNLETSNWVIKKLRIHVCPFETMEDELSQSPIKYTDLDATLTHLNVSLLPECIEKIQINLFYGLSCPNSRPRISGENNFPNLKHLHLTLQSGRDFSPFLEFFKHCPKLTTLTVALLFPRYDRSGKTMLKTSSVPPSVKVLRVMFGIRIVEDRSLQMESLIIQNY